MILIALSLMTVLATAQVGYVKGSDFGNFLKASCVYNQVDVLIKHTANESVEFFGADFLISFYEDLTISKQEKWDFVSIDEVGDCVTQYYTRTLDGVFSDEFVLILIKEDGVWKVLLPKDLTGFIK